MPTDDDASRLTEATRQTLAQGSPDGGDWPRSVRIERIDAAVERGELVVRVRFTSSRCPDDRLGTAFEVGETFWDANGGVLDAAWAASHVRVYFGEATWAGGDPCAWEPGEDGVRWYRDRLL